tara:strand:+ start:89 stop:442 length:354 start_codon:yes stop_codon:yes gene_type:complete
MTTAYAALTGNLASTLSSSFVIPSNVSAIKHISVAVATDDVVETASVIRLSGNALQDSGEQFVNGPSMNTMGSSVGAFNGTTEHDVDFAIQSGNSLEIAIGVTAAITGEVSVILTMQ